MNKWKTQVKFDYSLRRALAAINWTVVIIFVSSTAPASSRQLMDGAYEPSSELPLIDVAFSHTWSQILLGSSGRGVLVYSK